MNEHRTVITHPLRSDDDDAVVQLLQYLCTGVSTTIPYQRSPGSCYVFVYMTDIGTTTHPLGSSVSVSHSDDFILKKAERRDVLVNFSGVSVVERYPWR